MNVLAVAQELNRKAAEQGWYHFCDPTLAFRDPVYERFLQLWKEKAGTRPLPMRSEMTPRDLKDFLRDLVIFQRVAVNPSRYCWRLIGTKVTEVAGHNTGKTFEESVPQEHLPRWIECGDLLLDGGQPLRFLGRVHINGREYLDAENLFVPLSDDSGQTTFAMGLCHYTPRRTQNEQSWESQIPNLSGAVL
ncbi:MAG: PAS domain-containing protein [Rhizomicrobium sp.]